MKWLIRLVLGIGGVLRVRSSSKIPYKHNPTTAVASSAHHAHYRSPPVRPYPTLQCMRYNDFHRSVGPVSRDQ